MRSPLSVACFVASAYAEVQEAAASSASSSLLLAAGEVQSVRTARNPLSAAVDIVAAVTLACSVCVGSIR